MRPDIGPQVENQSGADETEADAGRDECHEHRGCEARKDHKRSASRHALKAGRNLGASGNSEHLVLEALQAISMQTKTPA
jgi:hypothetical protein